MVPLPILRNMSRSIAQKYTNRHRNMECHRQPQYSPQSSYSNSASQWKGPGRGGLIYGHCGIIRPVHGGLEFHRQNRQPRHIWRSHSDAAI